MRSSSDTGSQKPPLFVVVARLTLWASFFQCVMLSCLVSSCRLLNRHHQDSHVLVVEGMEEMEFTEAESNMRDLFLSTSSTLTRQPHRRKVSLTLRKESTTWVHDVIRTLPVECSTVFLVFDGKSRALRSPREHACRHAALCRRMQRVTAQPCEWEDTMWLTNGEILLVKEVS